MNETLAVVFASDHPYLPHFATALFSASVETKSIDLVFYLLSSDIIENDLINLRRSIAPRAITLIRLNKNLFTSLITTHHFKKENYYRLLMPKLIPYDYALYLDSDLIVRKDLGNLVREVDISDTLLAAVREPGFDRHAQLRMSKDSHYFNSGVIYANLKKWRESKISENVLSFIEECPQVILYVDQCGLNAVVNGRWQQLHPRYNVQSTFFEVELEKYDGEYGPGALCDAVKNPTIVHFTGTTKPWHFRSAHPSKRAYWQYRRQTPFKWRGPREYNLADNIKLMLPSRLRSVLKKIRVSKVR